MDNGGASRVRDAFTIASNVAKYAGQTIVIKFGGELAAREQVLRNLMVQAITLQTYGARVIMVHGGGRQITDECAKANLPKAEWINGVRNTTPDEMKITHRCLSDLTREIVNVFHEEAARLGSGASARGQGGNDGRMVVATEKFAGNRTGDIAFVDRDKLACLTDSGLVLVMNSVCINEKGQAMNVNADTFAAEIAIAAGARRLLLCSDIEGVNNKSGVKMNEITLDRIPALIEDGTITGGMIPKIEAAARVVESGVRGVVILNGANSAAITDELFGDGAGTLIRKRQDTAPTQSYGLHK